MTERPKRLVLQRSKKQPAQTKLLLEFTVAVREISVALSIAYEPARMTLYGLCATDDVRAFDQQGEPVDPDVCTISDFGRMPVWVSTMDVRHHLTEWSQAPLAFREATIEAMLRSNKIPPRGIPWKDFCNTIRDGCNGWLSKGSIAKHRPAKGFSDKQIQRITNGLIRR
jgi:hypothetical protein